MFLGESEVVAQSPPDRHGGGIVAAQSRAQAVVECDQPAASRYGSVGDESLIIGRGTAVRLITDPDRAPRRSKAEGAHEPNIGLDPRLARRSRADSHIRQVAGAGRNSLDGQQGTLSGSRRSGIARNRYHHRRWVRGQKLRRYLLNKS